MVKSMIRRGPEKFPAVLWSLMFVIALAALIGCSSGGDGGGGILLPQTVDVELGDATLTCASEGNIVACRGIPYAQPPEGDLRFSPPVAADPLVGRYDARNFKSVCVQNDKSGSENCLYLNVFFPKGAEPGDDLPVMVWIHGGAYIQGAASVDGYDLPALVKKDVIVVTINYRLNAFGFLPHPALEDPTGNFGLKDQVEALKWVRDNIADFGGDPGNVTIFGESAGGHSVLSLLVSSERDNGLFHKAIVQSGSYSPTQTALGTVGYYGLGLPFADLPGYPGGTGAGPCSAAGGCATCTNDAGIRACLRNLTVDEVMDTQLAALAWSWISPVYQAGTFLPQSISAALTAGGDAVADVPLIIGSNSDEGTLFGALFMNDFGGLANQTNYRAAVQALLAADPRPYDRIGAADSYEGWAAGLYGDNANKYRNAYSMIWTDANFTCNNLAQWTQLYAADRTFYAYLFADKDAPINDSYAILNMLRSMFSFGNKGFGAAHSFEIQYIFGHVKDHPEVTSAQKALSNRMIGYWTNFAKDGEPGGGWSDYNPLNGIWEMYAGSSGDHLISTSQFTNANHCLYWAYPGTYWPL